MDGWTVYNVTDGQRERVIEFVGPFASCELLVREIMTWPGVSNYILEEMGAAERDAFLVLYPHAAAFLVTVAPRPLEVPACSNT